MHTKPTFAQRLRYIFDNTLSRGTIALIGWLAVISVIIIAAAALVLSTTGIAPTGEGKLSFAEAAWSSMMRTLDAGTMGGDQGWGFRWVMFFVTVGGVFVISTLIGVLTSGLEAKIDELRKGKTLVIESGHTVILGWSEQIFTILSELVEANANQKDACVVILGNKDKIELQDEIRARLPETKSTRIVCRTGSPIELADLEITALNLARSIVILSPEEENPDAEVIKTILAITNNPSRKTEAYHIVAEIRDQRNMDVAKLVGKSEVEFVLVSDLVARIIAQTCRQSGLSVVYTELLDFGGDEIYFKTEPALVGKTYKDALFGYADSMVIGLAKTNGSTNLNPPMETIIHPDEQIIAIAEDDDKVLLSNTINFNINPSTLGNFLPAASKPEKTLILGWNWRAADIIKELDHYVVAGSQVTIVAEGENLADKVAACTNELTNQEVSLIEADTSDRRTLNQLQIDMYHHVIILCYSDQMSIQQADAHTLVTLLHLRDIAEKTGKSFSIVSEMLDIRNRNLADVTRADDFIVSDKLISLMLAQISENKRLNTVFIDIFDPDGSEIYLKPASIYVKNNETVSFYTILEAASLRGETAIGYRIKEYANDPEKGYGVVINPNKAALFKLSEQDKVIVLAEQ